MEISKNTGSVPPHLQQVHESALEVFSEPAASLTTSIPDTSLKEACQLLGLFGNEEDVIFLETLKSCHGLDPPAETYMAADAALQRIRERIAQAHVSKF